MMFGSSARSRSFENFALTTFDARPIKPAIHPPSRESEVRVPGVIVERSMDPRWLSNAYLVASEPGGTAVFVDSGAPLEPLFEVVERQGLRPTHLLITHGHGDHVAGNDDILARYDVEVTSGDVRSGRLRVQALPTP